MSQDELAKIQPSKKKCPYMTRQSHGLHAKKLLPIEKPKRGHSVSLIIEVHKPHKLYLTTCSNNS